MNGLTLIHHKDIPKMPPKYKQPFNVNCSWCPHYTTLTKTTSGCGTPCTDAAKALGNDDPFSFFYVETAALVAARLKA